MIERQILAEKSKEKDIEKFILSFLGSLSCSNVKIQRVPLGDKVSVYTSRPGLIVGRKGANIRDLTHLLKTKFKMENPQIEVVEIENPNLDAPSIAKFIVNSLERFGPKRFKSVAYKVIDNTIKAGARGVEVVIGGRGVPGERAKTWRCKAGYLKKSGDISENFVQKHVEPCNLKSGTIGIKVSILKPDVILPDDISIKADQKKPTITIEEVTDAKTLKKVAEVKEEKTKVVKKPVAVKSTDVDDAKALKKIAESKEKKIAKKKPVKKTVEKKEEVAKEVKEVKKEVEEKADVKA